MKGPGGPARVPNRRLRAIRAATILCCLAAASMHAKVIHREASLYQTVLVTERGAVVCLQFETRKDQRNQSCLDRRRPRHLVLPYTRMLLGALLLVPAPETILVIGLGGGILPTAFAELLPDAQIDAVEIDPVVVAVAERFFGFKKTARVRVFVSDARVFTRRAASRERRYDLIILDAFGGEYIPEHLMTVEYFRETRALLTGRGVVAANTFRDSGLHDHESETWHQAFGPFIEFTTDYSLNRILMASAAPLPDTPTATENARTWHRKLERFGVATTDFPDAFNRAPRWDRTKEALTDQYAPANLLRSRE